MSTDGECSAEPLPGVAGDSEDTRRALLDLAITAAGVGTFDWDLSTGRLGWDDRLIELFGYERGQFDQTMEAFTARLHAEDRDRVAGLLQAAIDTGDVALVAVRLHLQNRPRPPDAGPNRFPLGLPPT